MSKSLRKERLKPFSVVLGTIYYSRSPVGGVMEQEKSLSRKRVYLIALAYTRGHRSTYYKGASDYKALLSERFLKLRNYRAS